MASLPYPLRLPCVCHPLLFPLHRFPADYPDSLQGLSALYQYYYSGETILDPMNTCAFPPASLPYYAFLITMEATVRSVQKYDQRFQGKQFCIVRDKTVISQLLPKKSTLFPFL